MRTDSHGRRRTGNMRLFIITFSLTELYTSIIACCSHSSDRIIGISDPNYLKQRTVCDRYGHNISIINF
jgi:hypothetical protein